MPKVKKSVTTETVILLTNSMECDKFILNKGDVEMDKQIKSYAVFLDIDGTLLRNSPKALQKNIDVIQKVRSLGHKVLINTGRSTAYMPQEIDTDKYFDGVVSGAGARIILDKKEIFCKLMSENAIRCFCETCFDTKDISILEGDEEMYIVGPPRPFVYDWQFITRDNIEQNIKIGLKIEKFTILGNAPKELQSVLGDDYIVLQHPTYAEVIQKAYTKAGAMKIVLDNLGIPSANSIAVGDSLNDFDMISAAGIGVAMGNAIPEIKDIATMTTASVDEAGVAAALEKIFNI